MYSRQKIVLIVTLFFLLFIGVNLNSQVTLLHEFSESTSNGKRPQEDLVSDGIYLYGMTLYGGNSDLGTIFKIKKDGTEFNILHSFDGANGKNPEGSLILDGTTLYGMTPEGGTGGYGTIFKIEKDGTGFTLLHSFNGFNGEYPLGSLILDGTTLYGMTGGGGASGIGTIFKIEKDGTEFTVIHSFEGGSLGCLPEGSLLLEGTTLYGMTWGCGSPSGGIIFKIRTDGTQFEILHHFDEWSSGDNGALPHGSLFTDGTYLYGMTMWGGANDCGIIFKIDKQGTNFTILHSFCSDADDGYFPYGSLFLEGASLYGMTVGGGDFDMGIIFKIKTNGTQYEKVHSFNGTDGSAPLGSLIMDGRTFYGMTADGGSNNCGVIFSFIDPRIVLTSPNGGETWYLGESETITWDYPGIDDSEQIRLKLLKNDSVLGTIAENIQISNGSYSWNVGEYNENIAVAGNDYKISIETMDEIYSDQSNENFSIENPITVTSPNGGETLAAGSIHKITWKASSSVGNVEIGYSTNNGVTWRHITNYRGDGDNNEYNWKVPNFLSENCLVRVREINGDPSDVSDAVFSIVLKPSITVTSPNGGENWEVDSSHHITWSFTGNIDNVRIKYSTNNGESWESITTSTPNDGSYEWTVPNTPSDDCLVRVAAVDGHPVDESNAVFAIVTEPQPTLTVTSPNGGESWVIDTSQDITWTSTGNVGPVRIDYSTNNGAYWKNIVKSTPNDGIYNWTVPPTPSNDCLVRIRENDTDGVPMDVSDARFSIVPPSNPFITVISPNGGEVLFIDSIYEITWTSSENIENVKIKYSINNGETWLEIVESTPNDSSYEWRVPDTSSDDCLVRVSETDDDPLDDSDAPFSIIPGPTATITVTSPNYGGTLFIGTTHEIKWTSTGEVGNVTIEYTQNSGETWTNIAASTENDGSYLWTVPDTPSENCLVRVSEVAGDGGPSDISDEEFSIVPPLSETIIVISPNGREVLEVGSTHEITWTSTGEVGNVSIDYSINNGASWNTIVADTENDYSYIWTVPDTPSENCLVRIMENDGDGVPQDTSDAVFTIVSPLYASITVTFPNGGESLMVDSIYEITWTNTGDIYNVKIEYSINNGESWDEIVASTPNDGIYEWTVPDNPSDNCLIRVSDTDREISDTSNEVFFIVPASTITVTSPNGNETWEVSYSYDITWTYTGTVGNVKIEYSTNSGDSWTNIVHSTLNDGSYSWTIPDDPSSNCLVRISETNNDGGPSDVCDEEFSIVLPSSPTITVTSPNGGETLLVDSMHEITWTSIGDVGNVKIEYSTNSGESWEIIVDDTSNIGSYDWPVPDTPSDNCLVRVSETDDDPSDDSDAEFSIVSPSNKTITVTSPNGGESLNVGSTEDITWTHQGTIDYVMIEYSTDNGNSWTTITPSTVNSGTYNWTIPDTPSDDCLIRVSGNDSDDDPFDVSDAVFSIVSEVSESITVTSPNGGERVIIGSSHEITWESTGDINNVMIEYSFDNGASWTDIAWSTANDGSYEWTIPDTPSANCLVRIRGNDYDGQPSDVSDDIFSIIPETY